MRAASTSIRSSISHQIIVSHIRPEAAKGGQRSDHAWRLGHPCYRPALYGASRARMQGSKRHHLLPSTTVNPKPPGARLLFNCGDSLVLTTETAPAQQLSATETRVAGFQSVEVFNRYLSLVIFSFEGDVRVLYHSEFSSRWCMPIRISLPTEEGARA